MKLHFVEMAGFRGIRDPLRLEFSDSCTVISGRNGVGKSTVCDAIEFAISGEIRKYRVEKAAQESFGDYVWWRGGVSPEQHFVKVGLVDEDQKQFEFIRSREDGLNVDIEELIRLLCSQSGAPLEPLAQICKTSIVRDEWIAAQSLDLKETERFELVSAALGELETSDYGEKASRVLRAAEGEYSIAESVYQEVRADLSSALETLSAERSRAIEVGSISSALASIARLIPELPEGIPAAIAAATKFLDDARQRIHALEEAAREARRIVDESRRLRSAELLQKRESLAKEIDQLRAAQNDCDSRISEAKTALDSAEKANELAAALSRLVEGGETAGLHEGRCPLCTAERSDEEFQAGLALARSRAGDLGSTFRAAQDRFDQLQSERQSLSRQSALLRTQQIEIASVVKNLEDRTTRHIEFLSQIGLEKTDPLEPDAIERARHAKRNEMIEVERHVATLQQSHAAARISDLEVLVEDLRKKAAAASRESDKRKKAVSVAKEFDRTVKRTRGEIVDERLAAIKPLLMELYQRLRPHSDWRSIDYGIRGEVRRFLTLRVGDNLNPQFVFSSGQRRVAGLAFLLSVHLARPWSRLNTLILDDPVQHIDDFRALHIVELLAALRKDGHQIVCTVEDPSLGDLLTRRLAGTPASPGLRYDLRRNRVGVASATRRQIAPVPVNVVDFAAPRAD